MLKLFIAVVVVVVVVVVEPKQVCTWYGENAQASSCLTDTIALLFLLFYSCFSSSSSSSRMLRAFQWTGVIGYG